MKKLILALLIVASSLFAVTLTEIMNADPAYSRAHIVQVDIRDSKETLDPAPQFLTKLNIVNYPYLGAGYPYTNIEYSGEILNWAYTFDYDIFYSYSSAVDYFIDPNDLSRTYIIIDLQGYSSNDVSLRKYVYGQGYVTVISTTFDDVTYPRFSNGYLIYLDTDSSSITSYEVKTHIQASDGTVDLYSNISISRDVQ